MDQRQDGLEGLLAFVRRRRRAGIGEIAPEEYFGLDEVLELVVDRAAMLTRADGIAIALASEAAIVCRASWGRISPPPGVRLDPSSGFSGACLLHGQTVRCDDSENDERVDPEACRRLGVRSMVAVPLTAKGRVVGLIEAFSARPLGFNERDVRSLDLLGDLIRTAIHPAEEDRLAELAGQVFPEPAQPELETGAGTGWAFQEEAVSAPAPGQPEPAASPVAEAVMPPIPDPGTAAAAMPSSSKPRSSRLSSWSTVLARIPALLARIPLGERIPLGAPGLFAGLVLAGGLGWAWIHHAEQLTSANTNQSSAYNLGRTPDLRDRPARKPGATPEVTGVRHSSQGDSSTVVIDMEDEVQYETHALDNPPRIYFDLFDTKLAAGLLNRDIPVDDALIKRVRMSQPSEGTTRVVLDTKGATEVSVKLDSSPYRLTIDVHKGPASSPASAKPSPEISGSSKKNLRVARRPSSEFRVALDAGHGGWDLGTVGQKGLLEKDLVLDIVERLGRLIEEKLGAEVIYTRQDDTYLPLERRAEIANLGQADLFLSVHANYSDLATARGVETYYSTKYSSTKARTVEDVAALKDANWNPVDIRGKVANSYRLATDVQDALYEGLAPRNPAVRNRGVKEAHYVVLTGTQMPAILAEVSFVSSPEDEDKLESPAYRQQIADALYQGLARYRKEVRPAKMAAGKKPAATSESPDSSESPE